MGVLSNMVTATSAIKIIFLSNPIFFTKMSNSMSVKLVKMSNSMSVKLVKMSNSMSVKLVKMLIYYLSLHTLRNMKCWTEIEVLIS